MSPIGKFVIDEDVPESSRPIDHFMTCPTPKRTKSEIFMSHPNSHTQALTLERNYV